MRIRVSHIHNATRPEEVHVQVHLRLAASNRSFSLVNSTVVPYCSYALHRIPAVRSWFVSSFSTSTHLSRDQDEPYTAAERPAHMVPLVAVV